VNVMGGTHGRTGQVGLSCRWFWMVAALLNRLRS
jgi:hypothetical protein